MNSTWKAVIVALAAVVLLEFASLLTLQHSVTQLAASVRTLSESMGRLTERIQMVEPGELYASWYSAGTPPVLQEVKTVKRAGESTTDWIARHDADVAFRRTLYPPI